MGERGKIAAGANRSFLGNDRINATVQDLAKKLDYLEAYTAETEDEHISA